MKTTTKAPRAPKAPKATAPATEAPAPAPATEAPKVRKVRPSKFEGKYLRAIPTPVVPGVNNGADVRRQKASRRTASRAILYAAGDAGISFADYLAKGGHPGDLARDVRKGATVVGDAPFSAATEAPAKGKGRKRA